jgi:hypothetical protein
VASDAASGTEAASLVHEVLRSPGQPLDAETRAFFEPRFGHDFSQVRAHVDSRAAESARAVDAQAYTMGLHIVFDHGRFQPETVPGRTLLAHELAHVSQQNQSPYAGVRRSEMSAASELQIGAANDAAERDADRVAGEVSADRPGRVQVHQGAALMRKLRADRPNDPAPGAQVSSGSQSRPQTRAEVVEDYLRRLSPSGSPTIDRSSGDVSLSGEFCRKRGFFERVGRGIASGFKTGARIGAYFLGVGAVPGAILGALIGGVAGIFGSDSQAEESSTPTGSTCVCDMVNSANTWTIHIHDFPAPLNIQGADIREPVTSNLDRQRREGFVVVPAPNSPQIFGAATVSGRLQNMEPWLILGHELCGHAWLQDRQHGGGDEEGHVEGEDLRHHRTVERENRLRAEQGLEARGFRLKDPFCGESFTRSRSAPNAPPQFGASFDPATREALIREGRADLADDTRLDECQRAREQFFPEQARRFRVSERIP